MTFEPPPTPLTDEQKKTVCRVVATGCDRETAAKYARTTWLAIHATMDADPEFAAEVRFQEATAELVHMSSIRKAADDPKNWRTSVWWLERLAPERYGPRGTGQVSSRQLKVFIEHISKTLVIDVQNEEDRKRLLSKLDHTAKTLEMLLRDEASPEPPAPLCASLLLLENDDDASDEPEIDSAPPTPEPPAGEEEPS